MYVRYGDYVWHKRVCVYYVAYNFVYIINIFHRIFTRQNHKSAFWYMIYLYTMIFGSMQAFISVYILNGRVCVCESRVATEQTTIWTILFRRWILWDNFPATAGKWAGSWV